MNPVHKKFIESLMPFFGSTEEEVISHIIISWATSNEDILSKLEQINGKFCGKPEKKEQEVKQEKKEAPKELPQDKGMFLFRDCIGEVVITDSIPPTTHGKTTYYLDKETGLMRIERHKYPCATHAYLVDILHLYNNITDVRKLLKHIDHNRRPIITGFLQDVPRESLVNNAEKKDCHEKDCLNRSPEQCKFCTDKGRYESVKMKKTRELRDMVINMGIK